MSRNNDHTSGNLLDNENFSKHCKLIAIDLSKQSELENSDLKKQINFIGRLDEDNATVFFIIEKPEKTSFWLFIKFCSCCLTFIKMETQKVVSLLNDSDNESSKFATRKWYIINDQNKREYGEGNENDSSIKFETKDIKSNIWDYADAHILATGDVTATGGNANARLAFKNCAPFTRCVTPIND